MNTLFITIANFIIGIFASLPKQDISIDTTALSSLLGTINYFIPFYIIAPMLTAWFAFLGILIAIIAIWGYIKRNF